jgi:regulator of sirC expression with transglutaminase-like and TPR domain
MAEYRLAIDDYSQALQLDDGAAWVLWSRGLAYAQLNDAGAARQDLDGALAMLDGTAREDMAASTCSELIRQGSMALSLRYCARTVSK